MSKLPAFQFYPGDWMSNVKLRRCSHAARGAWMDVICILHDSDEYGVIRWPLVDLAQATNAPLKLLKELADKDVLKGSDKGLQAPFIYVPRHGRKLGEPVTLIEATSEPVWYCARLVRDSYIRRVRGAQTRFEPAPKPSPKDAPKVPIGERQGDGSSSSSSSSIPPNPQGDAGWGEIKIPEKLQRSHPFMEALASFRDLQTYHRKFNPISFEQTVQKLNEYPIRRAIGYLRYWVGIGRFQPKWDAGYEDYMPQEDRPQASSPKSYAPKIKMTEGAK